MSEKRYRLYAAMPDGREVELPGGAVIIETAGVTAEIVDRPGWVAGLWQSEPTPIYDAGYDAGQLERVLGGIYMVRTLSETTTTRILVAAVHRLADENERLMTLLEQHGIAVPAEGDGDGDEEADVLEADETADAAGDDESAPAGDAADDFAAVTDETDEATGGDVPAAPQFPEVKW